MSETVSLYDAKTHLSQLVDRAAAGEEIVITKSGKAMARLAPLLVASQPRRPAGALGLLSISPEFEAPLPADLQAMFDGEPSSS